VKKLKAKNNVELDVQGETISVLADDTGKADYISITDIAKHKNPESPGDVIKLA